MISVLKYDRNLVRGKKVPNDYKPELGDIVAFHSPKTNINECFLVGEAISGDPFYRRMSHAHIINYGSTQMFNENINKIVYWYGKNDINS